MCAKEKPLVMHIVEAMTGGVERHIEYVAETMQERGFDLYFLLSLERPGVRNELVDKFRDLGIGVDILPMKRGISPFSDTLALHRIRKIIRRVKPDIVHTHSSKAGYLGRRAAYNENITAVHTPHVFAFEWVWEGFKGSMYRFLERRASRWCDKLVMLSDAQVENAVSAGIGPLEKLEVIPNGVDAVKFHPPSSGERTRAREALGIYGDQPIIGMAARLEPQKGVGDFLRAASSLHQRNPDTKFIIAGVGSLQEQCRVRARRYGLEDALQFRGQVLDMPEFYHALDCFVLASLWEGMPYSILEAQACGLPVLATETTGAQAIIIQNESGHLVPVGDEHALAKAMEQVLNDFDYAQKIGSWGRARVEEYFQLGKWADQLAQCYRDLINKNHYPS